MTVYRVPKPWLVFHPILFVYAFVITLATHGVLGIWPMNDWQWVRVPSLICILLGWAPWVLHIPYEMNARDDGTLRIKSVTLERTIRIQNIVALRAIPFSLGLTLIKHSKVEILALSDYDQWYEFVRNLVSANPAILIKGFALPRPEEIL